VVFKPKFYANKLGQVSHLWGWKIYSKIPNLSIFLPLGQKKYHRVGSKLYEDFLVVLGSGPNFLTLVGSGQSPSGLANFFKKFNFFSLGKKFSSD